MCLFCRSPRGREGGNSGVSKRNLEARGHAVSLLLENLPEIIAVPKDIIEAGQSLHKL